MNIIIILTPVNSYAGMIKNIKTLIEKYMSRFDKRRESKKYNGIWY
jgi:hypothetical protein